MSTKYMLGKDVPTEVIADRLDYLSEVVANRRPHDRVDREFTMRIPAEVDRDADLVLSEAATRLREMSAQVEEMQRGEPVAWMIDSGVLGIGFRGDQPPPSVMKTCVCTPLYAAPEPKEGVDKFIEEVFG